MRDGYATTQVSRRTGAWPGCTLVYIIFFLIIIKIKKERGGKGRERERRKENFLDSMHRAPICTTPFLTVEAGGRRASFRPWRTPYLRVSHAQPGSGVICLGSFDMLPRPPGGFSLRSTGVEGINIAIIGPRTREARPWKNNFAYEKPRLPGVVDLRLSCKWRLFRPRWPKLLLKWPIVSSC